MYFGVLVATFWSFLPPNHKIVSSFRFSKYHGRGVRLKKRRGFGNCNCKHDTVTEIMREHSKSYMRAGSALPCRMDHRHAPWQLWLPALSQHMLSTAHSQLWMGKDSFLLLIGPWGCVNTVFRCIPTAQTTGLHSTVLNPWSDRWAWLKWVCQK